MTFGRFDMNFWGSLLTALTWIVWLTRNQIIFRSSCVTVNSLLFSILHLLSSWSGSSSDVSMGLQRTGVVAPVVGTVSVANPGGVATQHTAVGGATTESSTDEDLLD
jgi:hypothetical protein